MSTALISRILIVSRRSYCRHRSLPCELRHSRPENAPHGDGVNHPVLSERNGFIQLRDAHQRFSANGINRLHAALSSKILCRSGLNTQHRCSAPSMAHDTIPPGVSRQIDARSPTGRLHADGIALLTQALIYHCDGHSAPSTGMLQRPHCSNASSLCQRRSRFAHLRTLVQAASTH